MKLNLFKKNLNENPMKEEHKFQLKKREQKAFDKIESK